MSASAPPTVPLPEITIEAGRAEQNYWRDLWRYRELFVFLAWRDLIVRYKQTAIGVAWALLQPAMTTAVFYVFGELLNVPHGDKPRAVVIFAAQLPWSFFASSLAASSNSLVSNTHLISKVYFPRLIVPATAVVVSLVDFLIASVFLVALMVIYAVVPGPQVVALPLFLLIAFVASLGAGLWLTALNVKYRDFRFVVPFIIQLGLYASPIAFTSDMVPARWRMLYDLNPMVGVIDGFRWCLIDGPPPALSTLLISTGLVVALLASGIWYFRKTERKFADVI